MAAPLPSTIVATPSRSRAFTIRFETGSTGDSRGAEQGWPDTTVEPIDRERVAFPLTVASVGGLVVRGESLLVARMTYGPNRGRYMLPGGAVVPGELPEAAAVREVREETGVEARPLGVVGVVSTIFEENTHTYLLWLMEPVAGEPSADGAEIDHCCFVSFDELLRRDDVAELVRYLAARLRDGRVCAHRHADDFVSPFPDIPSKLFM